MSVHRGTITIIGESRGRAEDKDCHCSECQWFAMARDGSRIVVDGSERRHAVFKSRVCIAFFSFFLFSFYFLKKRE